LPELTRRFTLLRAPSGDPIPIDDLRHRFAEQRARGGPIQLSEAEEDMILETIGRIRSKSASSRTDNDESTASGASTDTGAESDYTPERSSRLSNNTTSTSSVYPASSVTSSPSSRSAKRYSNNLFSSGRLRDYPYLRSISQKSGSSQSAASIIPTDSSQSLREETSLHSSDSLRPASPEGGGPDSSTHSSPNEKTPVARSASLVSSIDDMPSQFDTSNHNDNSQTLEASRTASLQRASTALARVIKEIEEEADDEIVLPRTTRTPRPEADREHDARNPSVSRLLSESSTHHHLPTGEYEAGTAISSDQPEPGVERMSPIPAGRPGAASPTPRLPGYVPGMPRPMTPRDPVLDDDIRSHSTTPRATSPMLPGLNGHVSQLSTTSFTSRRGSDASRSTPRPTSPPSYTSPSPYLSRTISGRRTPDESQRDSTSGTEQEGSSSSIFLRRRPVSPLSGTTFQPMAVSPRPTTPSNVTWNVGPGASPDKAHSRSESRPLHSRNGSLSSEIDFASSSAPSKSSSMSPSTSLNSTSSPSKWNRSASPATSVEYRSPSSLSARDVASPLSSNRTIRSPTPTQTRTATSSTFPSSDSHTGTVRSPKPHVSEFSFGASQLSFSPVANSSRSSLESTGSSYHSDVGQARRSTLDVFSSSAGHTPFAWHELDKSSSATSGSSPDDCDFEDVLRRYAGLTK
ncbi:hypothetical protein ID866_8810, partial [Astraeus odoratus]